MGGLRQELFTPISVLMKGGGKNFWGWGLGEKVQSCIARRAGVRAGGRGGGVLWGSDGAGQKGTGGGARMGKARKGRAKPSFTEGIN